MSFVITGCERCLLLCIHITTSRKVSKIHQKSTVYILVLSNGLCCGPRENIKLTKPPIATVRLDGHIIAIYIDNLISIALTLDECVDNMVIAAKLWIN